MATTWLKPRHVGEFRTLAQALKEEINYGINPEKTKDGELVSSYECDPKTADAEFLLSKREYFNLTGKDQGDRDMILSILLDTFPSKFLSNLQDFS